MALRAAFSRRPALAYRHILVPILADAESETAVALAAELAEDSGSTITALVVVEVPAGAATERADVDEEAAGEAGARGRARDRGAHGRPIRASGPRARVAGEAIVEEAARSGATWS